MSDMPLPACPTPGCPGDPRYVAPGRGHRIDCRYGLPEIRAVVSDDTGRLAEVLLEGTNEPGYDVDDFLDVAEYVLASDWFAARVAAARAEALAPIEALINKIEREIAEQLAKLQLPDDGSGGFVRTCDIRAAIHTSNTTEENHEPT